MFFARCHESTVTKSLVSGSSAALSQGQTILETAFHHTTSSADKVNVVSELLNMKAKAPVEAHFAEPVSLEFQSVMKSFA